MAVPSKLVRLQFAIIRPFAKICSVNVLRFTQTTLGKLMVRPNKSKVRYSPKVFSDFVGEWIFPNEQKSDGIVLYLHGGGYVAGDIKYAKGFGTTLAVKNGIRVFCAAYRLAPEFAFPAALDDAVTSYKYLLESGFPAEKIIVAGESAGGGLVFALMLKLKELNLPLPAGLIALSPWTDLTLSGESYTYNVKNESLLTKNRLEFFASLYAADDAANPYISPLFGDLSDFPPSLIISGGDEILLEDSIRIHAKLLEANNQSEILVTPKMWHVYPMYGVKEAQKDHQTIFGFITEALNESEQFHVDAP